MPPPPPPVHDAPTAPHRPRESASGHQKARFRRKRLAVARRPTPRHLAHTPTSIAHRTVSISTSYSSSSVSPTTSHPVVVTLTAAPAIEACGDVLLRYPLQPGGSAPHPTPAPAGRAGPVPHQHAALHEHHHIRHAHLRRGQRLAALHVPPRPPRRAEKTPSTAASSPAAASTSNHALAYASVATRRSVTLAGTPGGSVRLFSPSVAPLMARW
ncbi:hypothetical protein ZEAMMB73_Zm00001d050045 [Zea mays]|uniref:Uncharacterized protein n=1 Tax=Zea mays TaxID=4577 RepID=A0A1D6PZJ0_MAIZE|nr:hypothetical protein ZEAMMB73_Zm00001d050045 [Zea mays]